MIVSPASSTDIAFTGKGPRSPRLKWLGYIAFWKWRSPNTGKVKYIWCKILLQVYQWIKIFLYLINCLYLHTFIVLCISAIVRWFLAWINLGNGPETFPFSPFSHLKTRTNWTAFKKVVIFNLTLLSVLYSVAFVSLRSAYTTDMSSPIVEEHHFSNGGFYPH